MKRLFKNWKPREARVYDRRLALLGIVHKCVSHMFLSAPSSSSPPLRKRRALTMASLRVLRPLAFRPMHTSFPLMVRRYSSIASAPYENLLISTPKPGVGLSTSPLECALPSPASNADVADTTAAQQSLSTVLEHSMPYPPPSSATSTTP